MLLINFDFLRKRYPSYRDAFDVLEAWWEVNHRSIRQFESIRIASWRPDLNAFEISAALNVMVREGLLKRMYGVRGPDRTLAIEGPFESVDEIPETLHGTGDDAFKRTEGDIIPVYREAVAQ